MVANFSIILFCNCFEALFFQCGLVRLSSRLLVIGVVFGAPFPIFSLKEEMRTSYPKLIHVCVVQYVTPHVGWVEMRKDNQTPIHSPWDAWLSVTLLIKHRVINNKWVSSSD